MHRQIQTLVQDAIDVVNRYPTSVIPDALGLIIQRAIVLGHQDCMRALRERGVIHDPCKGTAPVAATRPAAEQRLETQSHRPSGTAQLLFGLEPEDLRGACGGSR